MRTCILLLIGISLPAFAQAAKPGFTVTIHVVQSRIRADCQVMKGDSGCSPTQTLVAVIDGERYELESGTILPKGIVALGDYPAKLLSNQVKPTHEFNRTYDLMFPDGTTRKFAVVGDLGH